MVKRCKPCIYLCLILITFLFSTTSYAFKARGVKNVILLIGDGMGFSQVMITKICYGHLAMEDYPQTGYELTDSLSGVVTDSAAAGTAIATGFKTYNKIISMVPVHNKLVSVPSLLEIAKEAGKSTGLVTTTRITHATPAVFASHVENREMEREIAKQFLNVKPNVLLGGGKKYFSPALLKAFKNQSYAVVYNRNQLLNTSSNYVLGLFSKSHIPYVLDRTPEIPNLVEMTKKAIEILEKNPNGFFLMVEGGRIDHACHANDIASVVAETKEFDDVVKFCLDYAKKRGDTLVIILADHETGGLAIGLTYGNAINKKLLLGINASVEKMAKLIKQGIPPEKVISEYAHVKLSGKELDEIYDAITKNEKYALSNTIAQILNKKIGIGFISHKHTGTFVPLIAYGPGMNLFKGFLHHTDTSKNILKAMLFGTQKLVNIRGISSLKGDANGNRKIDEDDAYITIDYVGSIASTEYEKRLDMNNNGVIDFGDVAEIMEMAQTN